jgi:glyoxylase-like metal-dependent hydrolase (beta-lactamase superfamily II)
MKSRQITPHVTQLTLWRMVNAFLVVEDDGSVTLIDTTMKQGTAGIVKAAAGRLTRIALTHNHSDHIGAVDTLKAELGGSVQVLWPEGDKVTTQTQPDTMLKEGDRVGSLEVVASPGHSPGHIAFLDVRDRTLFAGDVYSTAGGVRVTNKVNPLFPLVGMATEDRDLDLVSARKLAELDPALLAVGHGKSIREPRAAMDAAIRRGS